MPLKNKQTNMKDDFRLFMEMKNTYYTHYTFSLFLKIVLLIRIYKIVVFLEF